MTASTFPNRSSFSPGRGGGRERQYDAEAEHRRDDDGDRRVAADLRRSSEHGDRPGRDGDADRSAEQERDAEQRGHDEAGEERVREGLRAVGELVEDHPASERSAGDPGDCELEHGPLEEPLRPRFGKACSISARVVVVVVVVVVRRQDADRTAITGDRDDRAAVGLLEHLACERLRWWAEGDLPCG